MTIFVDASAIVAMIARESEATSFAEVPGCDLDRVTSPLAIWEAVRGVESARGVLLAEARDLVSNFLEAGKLRVVAVQPDDAALGLDARAQFGKGVHPAGLNFGDCFAYACAKRLGTELLFKGNDFVLTDIKDATLP